jgi:transglutaminase-like putative cysteine protease
MLDHSGGTFGCRSVTTETPMDRRVFVSRMGLVVVATVAAGQRYATATESGAPDIQPGWRVFDLTTRVELPRADSSTHVWIPLPSVEDPTWIRTMGNLWQGNAASVELKREPVYGATMLEARWDAGEPAPVLEVTSRCATRDRKVDASIPRVVGRLDSVTAALYTRPTKLLPTDGIVRKTAASIVRGARTDVDQARAIYDWVVDNSARNPATRGCGTGDIASMLETGDLTGKCADLNALYVGLARSAGLPARDVYGIRVADSRLGYRSLGKSGDVTKAQHCRAEVWLSGRGWVPVDPADVRKVVLEERPGLTLNDDTVVAARARLFGAWEMNWVAFNSAHDVRLPGSNGPGIPFLMYPQGENAAGRFDCLDADGFRYRISAREITT